MPKLNLVKRNLAWWNSQIGTDTKLAYYPSIAAAYARALTGKRSINYLGRRFEFDNLATPLSLQYYPHEISTKILKNMDIKPKKVLDIGGNIGQFSLTLSTILNHRVKIDVFEPNPDIFSILNANLAGCSNIRSHNLGIGKGGTSNMHYQPGRSSIGSLVKQNAGQKNRLKQVEIKLTDDIARHTKTKLYDLVKIDVEGYEHDLLKTMKPLKTKYLFIEVSGMGRHKEFDHSSLFGTIGEKFGAFNILNSSEANRHTDNFDMLLRFN